MLFSTIPQVSFATDENITVTLKFDVSVVADDTDRLYNDLLATGVFGEEITNVPEDITVTVPKNSSVQYILYVAQEQNGFSAVGIEDDFVKQIGFVGNDILENLVSTSIGDYYSYNLFNSAGWRFSVDDVELTTSVSGAIISEDGAVIEGKYGLVTGWDSQWNPMYYDETFIENYKRLSDLVEMNIDISSFTDVQKAKFDLELEEAKVLLTSIYNEANLNDDVSDLLLEINPEFKTTGGMWIGLYEEKDVSFWGTGSISEQLEIAAEELTNAMNPLPANLISKLYVTTLAGIEEDNLVLNFEPDKFEYTIVDFTKDNFLSKYLKWKTVLTDDGATVSVLLNGESFDFKDAGNNWSRFDNLDWTNRLVNTLILTVTPPEESALTETTYTIKIFSEITDEKKVAVAKNLLTWDNIKGMNESPSKVTTPLVFPSNVIVPEIGEVSVLWSGFDGVIFGENKELLSRPKSPTEITLTATLTSGESSVTTPFTVTVLPISDKTDRDSRISVLLENIAQTYTEKTSFWEVMDMGAYKKYVPLTEAILTENAKQEFINTSIKAVSESNTDTDLAKAILALTSQGIDATKLYRVNSNTPIDAIKKLNKAEHSASVWSAPYTLAAYNRDGYHNRKNELSLVNAIIDSQGKNGAWDEFGTIDTTANAIAGLSFYMNDKDATIKANVNNSIENALAYLSAQQNEDGTFSDSWSGRNSNSTAMVAIALASAGVDVENDARFIKCGNTIIDGLLSFALEDNTGFGHINNTAESSYSTEQAFRALIALAGAIEYGSAYNIYNMNGITLSPARATGESASCGSSSEPQGDNISVKFSIKSDSGYWLKNYTVNIPGDGATVYHAFVKGCDENNIKYVGASKGYVSSITKGNKSLGEFTLGKNSGWLYKLNGETPLLGIKECNIEDGDAILFYYTKNYKKESGLGSFSKPKEEKEELKEETSSPVDSVFGDVKKDDWYYEAVKYVYDNNLMQGTGNVFEPESKMSRAMLVTVLYRMANPESAKNIHTFADVSEGQWYYDAVAWAYANGIVSGINSTEFAPNSNISREQTALIIYRFAKTQGYDVSGFGDISNYSDTNDISDWALEAIYWANATKLVNGTSETTLSPKATATRAQVAAILMRFCQNIVK